MESKLHCCLIKSMVEEVGKLRKWFLHDRIFTILKKDKIKVYLENTN